MHMRSQQLEEKIKRRREVEHQRATRTEELKNYYNYWGKVNARYQNWVSPQYYDNTEHKMQEQRQKDAKNAQLAERQEFLRQMLDTERIVHEELVMESQRPKTRKAKATHELLLKMNKNLKDDANNWNDLHNEVRIRGGGRKDEQSQLEAKGELPPRVKINWPEEPKEIETRVKEMKDVESRNALPPTSLSAPLRSYTEPLPPPELFRSCKLPSPGFKPSDKSFDIPTGNCRESMDFSPTGDSFKTFKMSTDFPMTNSATLRGLPRGVAQPLKSCLKSDNIEYQPTEVDLQMELPSSRIPSSVPKDMLPLLESSFSNLNLDGGTTATFAREGALDRAMRNASVDNVGGSYKYPPAPYVRKRVSWM